MKSKKYDWEVPEVDLNFRNKKYKGKTSDAIKQLKDDIVYYLKSSNVSLEQRQIYSAIYNALNYYNAVTYYPSPEYDIKETFLTYAISELNNDFEFFQKYNEMYPDDAPIIDMSARIKSPISFMGKIKSKVDEYLKSGQDLSNLNYGLKDLLGAQIVVNVPKSIKEKGKDAEAEFLYTVYLDFLKHHGIDNTEKEAKTSIHQYNFLPINDKYHPNRSEQIKNRAQTEGYAEGVLDEISIPASRPAEMDDDIIDKVTRDYVKYPKKFGYQSLHVYTVPEYSKEITPYELPNEIIPPKYTDCAIEYHFYTRDQYNYQAYGRASHRDFYKPHEKTYHRLAVPTFIDFDRSENVILTNATNNDDSTVQHKLGNRLRVRNFAECLYKFYHVTFNDLFNIPFSTFRDTFKPSVRDDILAFEQKVVKSPDNRWITKSAERPIVATVEELKSVKDIIDKYINKRKDVTEKKVVKHVFYNKPSPYVIVKTAKQPKITQLLGKRDFGEPEFDE